MARNSKSTKPPRSYPWLLPSIIAVAVVIVVAAIVWSIATGQSFF